MAGEQPRNRFAWNGWDRVYEINPNDEIVWRRDLHGMPQPFDDYDVSLIERERQERAVRQSKGPKRWVSRLLRRK